MPQALRPTFSESWYRVADLKVKLRSSAQISRQFYRGERWYVVRDPAGNQYHRLSAPAYRFIGLLDGDRTVSEAWELVGGQLADEAPTQNEVIQILSQLHSANLIESNVTPDAAVLLRRHKKMVQRQWQGRLMNILFPRIPLWDVDSFLVRWMPMMKGVLSWVGAIVWLAVVIGGCVSLAPEWPRLSAAASNAIDPQNWPALWASFVLIKAIHELGHGFACRRFGGEVHELGVMFLVLVPAPYVDASTAWSFPSKWARIFVGAGGMIFELFVAAIFAFVWLNTRSDYWLNPLAYNIMLVASVSTVIFNANPLLRYDGYYILADWLEIPNLRYRSTEYSMGLIKRHLFRVKQTQPLPPIGQRFWLLFYAIASSIYRTFVGVMIILMVWNKVPVLGVLMAIGGVVTWLAVPVVKTGKYLLIDPELHRKRMRATAWTVGFAAAVVVAIGMIPFNIHYDAVGIVEPIKDEPVRAKTNGWVDQILAKDGQYVKAGEVIAVCRDRELELQVDSLKAKMNGLRAQADKYRVDDQNQLRMVNDQMKAVQKELDRAAERTGQLVIKAPADGYLVAPDLHYMQGKYIPDGEKLGSVYQDKTLSIIAMVDQEDAALSYLTKGEKVDVKMAGNIGRTNYEGIIDKRMPTPTWEARHPGLTYPGGGPAQPDPSDPKGLKLLRPHVEVYITVQQPPADRDKKQEFVDHYVPGQHAFLRFEIGRQPLIVNWIRRVRQVIQSHSNSKWI